MKILIVKPDLIFVGQEHGKQVSLSSEIKSFIDKNGAWYEGNGGDKVQGIKYQGSWDDKVAKDIKGYPPDFLFVIFTNTKINKQKNILIGNNSIFNQILKTQNKFAYFKDRKFNAETLTKFLQNMGSDFLKLSQMQATKENVTNFINNGEREMWEAGETNAKNMADNANKYRDEWLAKQNKGVYFVGSDHIKEIEKLLKESTNATFKKAVKTAMKSKQKGSK